MELGSPQPQRHGKGITPAQAEYLSHKERHHESYHHQERGGETAPPTQQLRSSAVPGTGIPPSQWLSKDLLKHRAGPPEMLFNGLEETREHALNKAPGKASGVAALRATC